MTPPSAGERPTRSHVAMLAVFVGVFALAAVAPRHPADFWLENLLVVGFVVAIAASYRRFRFSTRSYLQMLVLLSLHEVGAHSTYSETPVGDWLADVFALSRNHYDRIVHFAFGLLMLRPLRELLDRGLGVPTRAAWVLAPVGLMAMSGAYELLESWAARLVRPDLGNAFLGTQGDPWDAQRDMTMALVGMLLATALEIAWRRGVGWIVMPARPWAGSRETLRNDCGSRRSALAALDPRHGS